MILRQSSVTKKILIIASLILFIITSCRELINPVDPESDLYIGAPSVDVDGDGIGQYEDVDEIVLVSPQDEEVVSQLPVVLSTNQFNPEKVNVYWIQVATGNDFSEINIVYENNGLTSNKCTISTDNFVHNTTYYWRAKAYDGSKWSDNWSEIWSFTLNIDFSVPQNPLPSDDSTMTDTTPLFDWGDVAGATGYNIQVNTNESFTGTVIANDDTLTASQYQSTAVLSNNTTYYWRVRVKNEDDVWGAWSNTWEFTIVDYFAKTYGGSGGEFAQSIQVTTDGGFIVAGNTGSFGAGGLDYWIMKLNSDGTIAWQKAYGGGGTDSLYSIQETSDGGFIVAGDTLSFGAGIGDCWILKLNSNGTIAWQKAYGGNLDDRAWSIRETTDGGFIVAGHTVSFTAWNTNGWILKLNSDGTIVWEKEYEDVNRNAPIHFTSIQEISDGKFVAAGTFGGNSGSYCIIKLNSDGTIVWEKAYGGESNWAHSIQETSDGGFIVAGETESATGDSDFSIIKLNSVGSISWQKAYLRNNGYYEIAESIQETSDGGFIVAGGEPEARVLKLNSDGTIAWQKTYGENSLAHSIQETSDGGFIVAGETSFYGAGGSDFWVLKLNSNGICTPIGTDTSITPVDTTATDSSLSITILNTTATETNTNATAINTDAVVNQQAPE